MKKIIALLLVSLLVLAGCSSEPANPNNYSCSTLKVYNTGVYIGTEVKSNFEKEFGVKVIYDQFASNEEMYTKLQGGETYDVLYPSDYMIERLIAEDYLMPIDKTQIPNFENLMEETLNWDYDPGNVYSTPYFWGNVGITYNKNNVSLSDLEAKGFNIMTDPAYAGKIYTYDSERDMFMMALKALGYSMNTTNETELQEAYDWLINQKNTMDAILVTDEVIDNMISGHKDLALMYSGDAVYVMMENEDMGFYVPETGTNLWLDAMVIPANSECTDLAYEWINYQLDYDVAYENTAEVCYTTPVEALYNDMIAEGGDFADYTDSYIVDTVNPNHEIFRFNDDVKKIMADLWTRVKAA